MLKNTFTCLKSTSLTGANIKALNIRYIGVRELKEMFPKPVDIGPYKYLHLSGIDVEGLLSFDFKYDTRFDVREKGLMLKLRRVMEPRGTAIGTEDSKTCDLAADLLTAMGWNTFPLSVGREPVYKFDIGLGDDVVSIPAYVVETDRPVLIVDEDKCIRNNNRTTQWGEHRLAGDMLVCGLAGNKLEGDISLHGMRIIGARFTFYHTVITKQYYMRLFNLQGEKMEIKRFPTFGDEGSLESRSLDFGDPGQREVIIDALARMSQAM
ncbi:hypothetical protein BGZ46_000133 [Entomortierella lignicola]|nr:hypothetical protein BGZ46_000133 [Entomortierella lignicola]